MKAVILYSQHDVSRNKVEDIKQRLFPKVEAIDVIEVYGNELGQAIKNILGPREFPCVIFVQDYLQGSALDDLEYVEACFDEQQDIDEREFHKRDTEFLKARLELAKEQGRKEIRQIVREAAELADLSKEARQKLEEKGILPKQS